MEGHEAREGKEETGQAYNEEGEEERDRDIDTPRGAPVDFTRMGEARHPPRGKHRPQGTRPRKCAPVVAGSLWRLPVSQ